MSDLQFYQYCLIGIIFVWGGFVRSSVGFGGAVLTLPFLLLIDDKPLVFLPIIAVHLIFFSCLIFWQNHWQEKFRKHDTASGNEAVGTIDWSFLKRALSIMIVPKMIGVFGILTLPSHVLSAIIFSIVSIYSVSYILNRPIRSKNKKVNNMLLALGGYVSGTSLTAAPIVAAVFAQNVTKVQLRDTMLALWCIMVAIKVIAFVYAGIDMQLVHHLWLLPCAFMGHLLGLRAHRFMLHEDTKVFYRVLGSVLLVASVFGLITSIGF